MNYITFDEQGNITGFYIQDLQEVHENNYLEVDSNLATSWFTYEMSEDRTTIVEKQVVTNIAEEKKKVNSAINAWRLARNTSSFTFQEKQIACDALSRSDLDAIANYINLFGEYPSTLPSAWKATDNSYIPIPDVDAFKAMYAAMVNQGNANFLFSQQMKSQLNSATSVEELQDILGELV